MGVWMLLVLTAVYALDPLGYKIAAPSKSAPEKQFTSRVILIGLALTTTGLFIAAR
jgi:hypothetical protein